MNYVTANIFGNGNRLKGKDRVIIFLRTIAITIGLTCCHQVVYAAEYHVGTNGNDGNSGTASQPWRTIGKANKTLQPGDTVFIHAGTYNDQIRPARSGTSNSSRIVYKAYGDGNVTLTAVGNQSSANAADAGGVALGLRNYITIDGGEQTIRVVPGSTPFATLGNLNGSSYCIIDGVYFDGSTQTSPGNWVFNMNGRFWTPIGDSQYNVIRNSYITGRYESNSLRTEDTLMMGDDAHHNLIENNTIGGSWHVTLEMSSNSFEYGAEDNVIRNNIIDNPVHSSLGMYGAGHRNLIEGNTILGGAGVPQTGAGVGNGIQHISQKTIIRYNLLKDLGASNNSNSQFGAIAMLCGPTYGGTVDVHVYNNTIVDNQIQGITIVTPTDPCTITDNIYANNLLYNNGDVSTVLENQAVNYRWVEGENTADRWLINFIGNPNGANPVPDLNEQIIHNDGTVYTLAGALALTNPGDPEFDTILQSDPGFVNYAGQDYQLASDSVLINAGGELTNVATTDTGSGTTLIVDDALFFQDGKGIDGVEADWIAVGNVSNTVQISSINYATNSITLTSPASRQDGQKVWLYKRSDGKRVLYGSASDIGAYEYASETGSVAPPSAPTNVEIVQ